jgi:hypothetical protein
MLPHNPRRSFAMWAKMSLLKIGVPLVKVSIAVAAIALLASGCAAQTKVEKLYQHDDAGRLSYERILVVGIAGDASGRRQMEDLVTEELANVIESAVPAYSRVGVTPSVTQDAIDIAAEATGSDAILVTHIVSVSTMAEVHEGRVDIRSECRGGNPADYFLYDHEELREPDSVTFAHEVVVVSNLYEASTGTRLWTIQSTCVDKANLDSAMRDEAKAIVRQLLRDGLIR